jgi:hypothetical protein
MPNNEVRLLPDTIYKANSKCIMDLNVRIKTKNFQEKKNHRSHFCDSDEAIVLSDK